MDKNTVSGAADKAKGAVKEAVGKTFGDDRLRAEGQADKAKGEVKQAAGKVADAARDAVNRTSDAFNKSTK
ncbi:MAG TPA: CsbD family protein [Rhizomicrobium sp.]|jgi:uncharacterized protein YjbJ (UPF0337 family)